MKKINVFHRSIFRLCILVTILTLGINPIAFSQNLDISTEENEDREPEMVKERLRNYRADIDNKNVKLARINGLNKLFQREKFNLKIPNYTSVFEVEKRRLMYEAEDSWTYFGTMYNKTNDLAGELSITNYFGEIYGEIVIDNQLYTLDNAELKEQGNFKLYFVEKNMDIISKDYCGVTQGEREGFDENEIAKMRSMSCSGTTVNVGFVYTEKARQSTNCPAKAMNSIQALNDALLNSDIAENELEFRVRIIKHYLNFNENNYNTNNSQLLIAVSNDQFIQDVRNDSNSDIVVVLTNRNASNQGTIGRANLNNNGNSETGFACWAEADHSNTIIEHEIGHLFGCKHQNDIASQSNIPFWARANNVTGARTIMTDIIDNADINNFSNPDVFVNFGFVPTGASDRNNSQRLRDQAQTVTAYRTESTSANIDGPSSIWTYNPNEAIWCVSTCSAISSYLWKWSSNGWSYSYLDNTACLSRPSSFFGTSSGHFFLRLTVTFNNGTTTTKNLTVIRQSGGTFLINPNEEGTLFSDNPNTPLIKGIHLYPNPAKDIINIAFENEHNSSSRIEILSHQGRVLKAIEIANQQSNTTFEVRIDDMSPGMYFIKQYSNNKKEHKFGKFVKTQ